MNSKQRFLEFIKNDDLHSTTNNINLDDSDFEWLYPHLMECNNGSSFYVIGYMYLYGRYLMPNYQQAYEYYVKSADKGCDMALNSLGLMFEYGNNYIKKDYKQAFEYYNKSAEKGNDEALCNLGLMYFSGLYVKQDYQTAYIYLYASSEKGNSIADGFLGLMYENGIYVKKNLTKAYEYYFKSAKGGSKIGIKDVERMNSLYPHLQLETKI